MPRRQVLARDHRAMLRRLDRGLNYPRRGRISSQVARNLPSLHHEDPHPEPLRSSETDRERMGPGWDRRPASLPEHAETDWLHSRSIRGDSVLWSLIGGKGTDLAVERDAGRPVDSALDRGQGTTRKRIKSAGSQS